VHEANLIRKEENEAQLVLIPAGSFEMGDHFSEGDNGGNEGGDDERPVHAVELESFYMDIREVTVGQFKQFLQETDKVLGVVILYLS